MAICNTEIIDRLKCDVDSGFRLLVRKYKEPVYWHIRRIVVSHSDAQDAMQETFVRIFKSYSSVKDANAFRAWIYRIATNEALRLREKNSVELQSKRNTEITFLDNFSLF